LLGRGEESIIGHSRDYDFQLQPQTLAQIAQEFSLDQLALGGLCPPLGFAAMFTQSPQFGFIATCATGPQPAVQETVHRQVGITPDRRSEMAVSVARQGVVAFFIWIVSCLFETA